MHKLIVGSMVVVVMVASLGYKFIEKGEKIKWMSLKEVQEANIQNKKPILIDLYTEWCGWCKQMDRKTYSDKNVVKYLQGKFYTVKLNAETRNTISWSGKTFEFNSSYKTNDFALYLTQGRLSYPTTVIIPADGSAPQAIPGYLTPSEIEIILKYFGEGKFGKQSFEDYQRTFKASW